MDCPKCKAMCFWAVVGTDPHFGEIKELSCSECGWSEGDNVDVEEEVTRRCSVCGNKPTKVRPGKYQCDFCEAANSDLVEGGSLS